MTAARRSAKEAASESRFALALRWRSFVSLGLTSLVSAPRPPSGSCSTGAPGWPSTGIDPVAYFTDAIALDRARGARIAVTAAWSGGSATRATAPPSPADPDVYMPQFGGYDPVVLARGVPTPGHPQLWLIAGDRLYHVPQQRGPRRLRGRSPPCGGRSHGEMADRAAHAWCPESISAGNARCRAGSPQAMKRRHQEASLRLTIGERAAVPARHQCRPPRRGPHGRPRCPTRRSVRAVDRDRPSFGDQAELERRAETHPRGHRQAAEESCRWPHRDASGSPWRRARRPGALRVADRRSRARAGVVAEHAGARLPRPTTPRQSRPCAGAATTPTTAFAIGDERDVDGEFVPAGDEFPRAVERIDQQRKGRRQAGRHAPRCLLGYHRHAGQEPRRGRQG